MKFRKFLNENIVYLDGGMGTILQKNGLMPGEYPERWNVTHKHIIRDIHKAYYDAGSNVVNTNTFGANTLKFTSVELDEIVRAAVDNVKWARDNSTSVSEKFVALDIGPSGKLLKPYGDFDFEDAVSVFAVFAISSKYIYCASLEATLIRDTSSPSPRSDVIFFSYRPLF